MSTIDKTKKYYDNLPNDYQGYDDKYKFIIENISNNIPFSFSRFNDGEIIGIKKPNSVVSRGSQKIHNDLHNSLIKSITHKQDNYYIGVPCPKCYTEYHKIANDLIGDYDYKVSAVCNINRNYAKFINEFKEVLSKKEIIWVGGDDQKTENITHILNIKIKKTLLFSSKNVWEHKDSISKSLEFVGRGDIVLFSLGPAGRILSQELFYKNPDCTFIDVGSLLDPITRNVWNNYHKGWENGFNLTRRCVDCN